MTGYPEREADASQDDIEIALKRRLADLKSSGEQIIEAFWHELAHMQAQVFEQWASALNLYDLVLAECEHAASEFNHRHRGKAVRDEDATFVVMSATQARACVIASEVRALVTNGHPDGAIARWRTLHELLVVMTLISQHGADLAQRYIDYDVVQTWKALREYSEHADWYGSTIEWQSDLDDLKRQVVEMQAKYGEPFANDNGWAADMLNRTGPKSRVTISDLVKAAGMEHFRPIYSVASNFVHSNVKSFGDPTKLGQTHAIDRIEAPAVSTLDDLRRCTTLFLRLHPTSDTRILEQELHQLVIDAGTEFLRIAQQFEVA